MIICQKKIRQYIFEDIISREDNRIYSGYIDNSETRVVIKEVQGLFNLRIINSNYVVRILDYFWENGFTYIVTEFIQGITLDRLLREKGALDTKCTAYIAYNLAKALNHIIQNGEICENINPKKVYLTNSGSIKVKHYILDEFNFKPNIYYRAPELFKDGERINTLTNIYSYSVILYQMLTGLKPFMGEINDSLLDLIKKGKYYPVKKMNREASSMLAKICKIGMSRNPNRRFSDFYQIINKLKPYIKEKRIENPIILLIKKRRVEFSFDDILKTKIERKKSKSKKIVRLCLIGSSLIILGMLLSHYLVSNIICR